MRIFSVDTTVTRMLAVSIAAITATLVPMIGLTPQPASAAVGFCFSEANCVIAGGPSGTFATHLPASFANTQADDNIGLPNAGESVPGGPREVQESNIAQAGAGACEGKPGVFKPNSEVLCAP